MSADSANGATPATVAAKTKASRRHLLIDPKLPHGAADRSSHRRLVNYMQKSRRPAPNGGLNFWQSSPAEDPIGCAAPSAARAEPPPERASGDPAPAGSSGRRLFRAGSGYPPIA